MRKPSEMYVAPRMQNMVQIHAHNACFASKLDFASFCCNNSFGALGVESPDGGAMSIKKIPNVKRMPLDVSFYETIILLNELG